MEAFFEKQFSSILKKYAQLAEQMATNIAPDVYARLAKEFNELEPIAQAATALEALRQELQSLTELLEDPAWVKEAGEEIHKLKEKEEALLQQIKILLLPKDEEDAKNVILEVRAGTGGEEAALFAADLVNMYERYAASKGWRCEVMELSRTDLGGVKEAVLNILGENVFAQLKFESGVHRIQRVPATEAGGRIHTSTATVAVLPEAEDVDVKIEEKDLRIDVYRASGAGGQHVNKTESAIRITHLPTGFVVQCQDGRSQLKNKTQAMKVLKARLYASAQEKVDQDRASARKSQVRTGDRSERIRTYNVPQGRVTDHRINLTLYNLPQIMAEGRLEPFVEALRAKEQAERLAQSLETL